MKAEGGFRGFAGDKPPRYVGLCYWGVLDLRLKLSDLRPHSLVIAQLDWAIQKNLTGFLLSQE